MEEHENQINFRMRLADIPLGIHAQYESTREFCRDYLTEDEPRLEITVTQGDIAKERALTAQEKIREDQPVPDLAGSYLETLALYRKITAALLDEHVLLLHGSVIARDGSAYLFTARSGTGKTTHTRLWLKNIPDCHVLNGDKPLLLFRENKVFACGTPWQGKENYGTNEILPLQAICILERDRENAVERISFASAASVLARQSHHPEGNSSLLKSMHLVQMLSGTDIYRLRCNMEDEAAWVAYRGICRR